MQTNQIKKIMIYIRQGNMPEHRRRLPQHNSCHGRNIHENICRMNIFDILGLVYANRP